MNSSPKNENMPKMSSPSGLPRCRWICFFIRTDLETLALHHLLTNGTSAVNGCRQNESRKQWFTVKTNCVIIGLFIANAQFFTSCGLLWCFFYQLFVQIWWTSSSTSWMWICSKFSFLSDQNNLAVSVCVWKKKYIYILFLFILNCSSA